MRSPEPEELERRLGTGDAVHPRVGLGCVVLALTLPLGSVVAGTAVLALGASVHVVRR